MNKNYELMARLIKSELTQMDLNNSESVDVELFNKLFNVIISDRLQIAQEIYELIDYSPDELDGLLTFFADKETIQAIIEQYGYTDIRTIDYISDCIRTDLKDYFNWEGLIWLTKQMQMNIVQNG